MKASELDSTMKKSELQKKCEALQKEAGFTAPWHVISECPDCGSKGYTDGWGMWHFECGMKALSCGQVEEDCPRKERAVS